MNLNVMCPAGGKHQPLDIPDSFVLTVLGSYVPQRRDASPLRFHLCRHCHAVYWEWKPGRSAADWPVPKREDLPASV